MCPAWGKSGICYNYKELVEEDLKFELFKKLIDEIKHYKTDIILSGGEPLLHKEWYEFAKYAKSKNLRVALQTNGSYIYAEAEKIIDSIDCVVISIDGNKEIHDEIRGCKGSYESIIKGIKKIKQLRKWKKPAINIQFTITPWNYKCLKEIVEPLYSIGIDAISFMHLMFFNKNTVEEYKRKFSDKFNIGYLLDSFCFELDEINIDVLSEQINKVKKLNHKYKNISFLPDLTKGELEKYYISQGWQNRCYTPWRCAFLVPNGDLYPCAGLNIGNIKNSSFDELWNNKTIMEFRKILSCNKYLPICNTCQFRI